MNLNLVLLNLHSDQELFTLACLQPESKQDRGLINPQSSRGIFHQNYLKTTPIQSKIDYAKFKSPIVHLTVRSCT
jgi:hypothetical protein